MYIQRLRHPKVKIWFIDSFGGYYLAHGRYDDCSRLMHLNKWVPSFWKVGTWCGWKNSKGHVDPQGIASNAVNRRT